LPVPGVPEGEADRVAGVRMRLLEEHPFWGYLLMQVKLVPNVDLPTLAATDCLHHIWYNPNFTCHLDRKQLGFVFAHEVGHQVFASFERQYGRDHHLWNCATDFAINRIVSALVDPASSYHKKPLYSSPNGEIPGLGKIEILLDASFAQLTAEAIYDRLVSEGESAAAGGLPQPRANDVMLDGEVTIPGVANHQGGIDIHLPIPSSEQRREVLADRMRAAVEFWEASDKRGTLPGEVLRAYQEKRSRVPWQRLLRAFVSQATSRVEYDVRRPQARWLEQGFVVPSWGGEAGPCVVIALDTSGSINPAQLGALIGEVRAVAAEAGDGMLIVHDAKVQEVVTLEEIGPWLRNLAAKGGGGTSHIPVFDRLREEGVQPDVFIGLTDLYSEFPERTPPFPVVWLVPPRHGSVPFGRVIVARA
jgi:predicted metal-dependent peptidase